MKQANILGVLSEPYALRPDASISPLGNGHINLTFLLKNGDDRMVAQQINTAVFPMPQQLVQNAARVNTHLLSNHAPIQAVSHLPGMDGNMLHGADQNIRVLEFISGSRSIEVMESPEQAHLASRAFAAFSRHLSGLDPATMDIVIPNFHSPAMRLDQFRQALQADAFDRLVKCRPESEFALEQATSVQSWQSLMDSLPERICHNDCKINNVLFDQAGQKILAVIDLDTCMPGRLMTDFGDLVRSCTSPEAEDSTDLDKVVARPEIYSALLQGYLEGIGNSITQAERDSLLQGAMMVCLVTGLRFLTDFLAGDSYFGARHPLHNLERAQNQFQLYRSLLAQQHDLEKML